MDIIEQYTCQSLNEVRENIDRIDDRIVRLIAQRYDYVNQAAALKKDIAEITDSKRIGQVIEKVKQQAKQNNIDENIIEPIYRTMINAFIKEEVRKFDSVYDILKKSYY